MIWIAILILAGAGVVLQLMDMVIIVREAEKKQKQEILDTIDAMLSDEVRTSREIHILEEVWLKIYTFF